MRAWGSGVSDAATNIEREKQLAAHAAAELVQDSMWVGLGSGSTSMHLLAPLAERKLNIRCVATSPATASEALRLGLDVVEFSGPVAPQRLDIAIDGADEVDPSGWLVKGGGGAHTREKAVAVSADRFVVIVSSDKLVDRLTPPIPLELLQYGLASTLARLDPVTVRHTPFSPDGGVIADYVGEFDDAATLAARLSSEPGVIEHGLFPASMVAEVLVGRRDGVERLAVSG